jgi:multidrug resistance efflux pump
MKIDNRAEGNRSAAQEIMVDARQRSLALGMEFTKRCFEVSTPDELFFLLTNDIRVLAEFDRSILIVHAGGESRFVAAANQPMLETKSKYHRLLNEISEPLRGLKRGVLLAGQTGTAGLADEDVSSQEKAALESYLRLSGCSFLLCVPLRHNEMTVAHLILEFLGDTPPDQISVVTVLNLAPLLAAAIEEKWLLSLKPGLLSLVDPLSSRRSRRTRLLRYAAFSLVGLVLMGFFLFVVPFSFDVGGEADVVARDRHVAFCQLDSLVERVNVAEGSKVTKGQVLAALDGRELDYKIRSAQAQYDILTREMILLRNSSGEDPAKLAESNLAELKRKAVWEELDFHRWHLQFLEIKAPVDGFVLTRDIERLVGKKLRAGEPFCEIVAPGELAVDTYVPEDRISYVTTGLPVTVHLAGNPRLGYDLTVQEINPMAEVTPRLGNVYRVRAPFPEAPVTTMVGMKGIGKIHVMTTNLWSIASDRIVSRWQRWTLWF